MASSIFPGNLLLIIGLLATLGSLVGAFRWTRGNEKSRSTAAVGAWVAAGSLIAAFLVLLRAFLTSDFRLKAVVNYSSLDLSTLYKVSAVWAGQVGSLLMWVAMGACLALALLKVRSSIGAPAMVAYQAAQAGLLGILVAQNPFEALPEIPADGHGLNPLLQDPWMASHPPVVFLGYAAAALPFALAIGALWRGERDSWLPSSLRFNLVTLLTLGAGILLGAFWAYEVLGWGGYWGWDPVENSSLIPWLVGAALLHGLLVQRRTGALVRMNLALAIGTYVLVLYATFLTRSGVLSSVSVHSFPQGGILAPLLTLIAACTLIPAVLLMRRWKELVGEPLLWKLELGTVLSVGLGLILLSAGVILLGTSWPLISAVMSEPTALEPGFYNQANLPIYVLIAALLVAAPLLGWTAIPARRLARVSIVPVVTGFVTAGLTWAGGIHEPLFVAVSLFSGAAVGSCIVRILRTYRTVPMAMGAPVAHIGMALILLGVLISSAGESRQKIELPLGEAVEALNHDLMFEGLVSAPVGTQRFRVAVDVNEEPVFAALELVQTDGGNQQHKPAIVRKIRGDLYLSPLGVDRTSRMARSILLNRGVPVQMDGDTYRFDGFNMSEHSDSMRVAAVIRTASGAMVEPSVLINADGNQADTVEIPTTGAHVALLGMKVESDQISLQILPPGAPSVLHVEASWKPGMNLLWGGSLLLCLGMGIAMVRRFQREGAPAPAQARRPVPPGLIPGAVSR